MIVVEKLFYVVLMGLSLYHSYICTFIIYIYKADIDLFEKYFNTYTGKLYFDLAIINFLDNFFRIHFIYSANN